MRRDGLTVRHVGLRDAADLHENCFSTNTLAEVQSRVRENLDLFEQGEGIQLVAEVRGAVVGTVTLRRNPHLLLAHRAALDSLVVHSEHRRRGIGRCLVEESRGHAASLGIGILEAQCRGGTPAEQVYLHLGLLEYGRVPRCIVEPWRDHDAFDVVYFYQPIERPSGG
jgi:GNAT superfamily N-acetyltransferase